MINGFGHYDFDFQRNQIYQRSPDMRLAGSTAIMNPQDVQGDIITPQENFTYNYGTHILDSIPYKSSTTIWNLNKILRRCGIPVPMKYCTKMWCVKDVAGYVAAGFTWFFIFIGEFLIILNCLSTSKITATNIIGILVTLILSILAFISHCKCMFSDPGTIPRGNATEEHISKLDLSDLKQILKCVKCNSIKPDRAHHCSTCQRCVRKMDHHCPWINNCVGEFNQKFFVLFTGYVCLMSCCGFAIALSTLINCLSGAFEKFSEYPQDLQVPLRNPDGTSAFEALWSNNNNGCYFSLSATLVSSISLLMESLMFGIFTAIMCGTQLHAICSDKTGIESLKKENRKRKTCTLSLREVFGRKFSYKWLSPFHESPECEGPTFLASGDAV